MRDLNVMHQYDTINNGFNSNLMYFYKYLFFFLISDR